MFDPILIERFNTNVSVDFNRQPMIPQGPALIGFIGAILIFLVGVVGNSITILAFYTQLKRMKQQYQATTTFVVYLAITDLSFCLICLPITAGRFLNRSWPYGQHLCRLFPFFYYGTVASSLMLITMITINRFILIAYTNLYHRIYIKRNVLAMILFCYLFSFGLLAVPLFEFWGRTGYRDDTFSCTILRDHRGRSPKKFLFILGFFLPMLTILICYGLIWFIIKYKTKRFNCSSKEERSDDPRSLKSDRIKMKPTRMMKSIQRRGLRLTILIVVIFGAFILCFLPLFIGNVLIPENRYPYFHIIASVIAWSNSCVNPFLYFAMNQRYRQAFNRLFCRQ
ncbi:Protein trapped in endoderm-1 [Sarcoptes scabiei]|uniref:Protein trapped in endoderm-1 n=1 Tax=Sarcoptes scabiei TaxID=52283 RepID=A0A834VIF4_SARSC|nr:Protein trapped in endoderm-1 [Sarcoptes scabiei]UXI22103.1 hypothetical protein NH340_JMT08046 [Sarcoptes scabiei]